MKACILVWLMPILAFAQTTTSDVIPPWQTGVVTEDGTCGQEFGSVCSPVWGACCSKAGKCGRSSTFCGDGCQVGFGNCNAPPPKPPGPGDPTPDGSCSGVNQFKCTGAAFGTCCSPGGFCGDTSAHCGDGCQSLFGTCAPPTNISSDGKCGANGKICTGSEFGDCCSASGFCGKGDVEHCGPGCQDAFGLCDAGAGSITTDGACGKNGKTCKGSSFGDCCSADGFCGGTDEHCSAGCQSEFGSCAAGAGSISTDGACGKNSKTCKGSTFGDCCSPGGFCGGSTTHCGPGCQLGFGTCDASAGSVSSDGACGKNGKTCKGSTFGDCCSKEGFCGKGADHCSAGCQASWGVCDSGADAISTDGACGKNGKTCTGSGFGDCCSSGNFCGSDAAHCAAGCQATFGTCTAGTDSISTDGACGKNGKTCKGSSFGDCCSSGNFCGKTSDHCGAGCQTAFGTCNAGVNNISTDGACSKNGKTCKGSTFGDCCSSGNFCGTTTTHCGAGCQSGFGTCSAGSGTISTDGVCGTKNGKTCVGSTFGNCCSSAGNCGNAATHCGQDCQKGSSSACLTSNIPTNDGACGAQKGGFTCAGGNFNNQCCSSGGFCGTTANHCGSGCQKGYGRCT